MNDKPIQIAGRKGSLFTRLPLIFAEELGIAYDFVGLKDLAAMEPAEYAGNPALRMPILRDNELVLYGSENICRSLAERANTPVRIVWPENLVDDLSRNAQELVWHCMTAQVQILMAEHIGNLSAENVYVAKARAGLKGSLDWLEEHATDVLAALPKRRDLSFFEVTLYCLVDHLQFGPTVPVENYDSLMAFARHFGARPSAQRTAFR
jgi:glutathione S-transferase